MTKDVNEMISQGLSNKELDAPKLINPEIRSISGGAKMSDFIDVEADE